MDIKENFKCEYCPSVLSSKYTRDSHMKRNKSCLKRRGLLSSVIIGKKKICDTCGFSTTANNGLIGHTCRKEVIEQINKIKLLEKSNDKLHNDIKCLKLDYKDIIDEKNEKCIKLEKININLEIENEKINNKIFNLDRDLSLTIDELKAKIEKYENKIFDIASKPSTINNNTTNTTNTNNIQMLIQKLLPVTEPEMIKLFETVCTKKTMLNGVDSLMEELGAAMKNNHMLCTDSNRNKLTYKNEENEVMKDINGKLILPKLCQWGQPVIDKGYMEAETEIKNRTTNEDDYDSQMRYLDNEWQYKYPRIKSGIGEKETKKAAKIISEMVKIT